MNNLIERTWTRSGLVFVEDLRGTAFTNENGAHTFSIGGKDEDGNDLALSGSVAGSLIRPDGTTTAMTGTIAGGRANVTLDPDCYGVPGRASLTIFLTSNGQKTAIFGAVLNIAKSSTSQVSPSVTADVVDLVNRIDTAVATIPASYTALMGAVAADYSSSATYKAGDWRWYSGSLYRAKQDIDTAESWTSSHWEKIPLASGLTADIRTLQTATGDLPDIRASVALNTANIGTLTGDISDLSDEIAAIVPGLTEEAKLALLNCFQHVAWADDQGQGYYDELEDALNGQSGKTLLSISAIFDQGQAVVYPYDKLEALKPMLSVVGHYDDGSSATISSYIMTGTLAAGNSTITVSYKQKTASFTVVVTAKSGVTLLRSWDFTKSMVDSVAGAEAATTAVRNASGLNFEEPDTYADFGAVYSRGRTYEIDIEYIKGNSEGNSAYRKIFAFGENGTNTAAATAGLPVAMSTGRPGWWWYKGSGWDSGAIGPALSTIDSYNYFDGKTMRIYLDSSGYAHVFAKGIDELSSQFVELGASKGPLNNYSTTNAHVYVGGSVADGLYQTRIKGFRVINGEA